MWNEIGKKKNDRYSRLLIRKDYEEKIASCKMGCIYMIHKQTNYNISAKS